MLTLSVPFPDRQTLLPGCEQRRTCGGGSVSARGHLKPLGHQRDPAVRLNEHSVAHVMRRLWVDVWPLKWQASVAEEDGSLSSEDFYAK